MGNSFTQVQGGLETHLRQIAGSMSRPRSLTVERASQGGTTLELLRQVPAVMQAIQAGGHDIVVIQDDIPEYADYSVASVEPFKEQVRWYNQQIRAKSGRPVLFMAWAYQRLNWISMATIAQAHREIGAELGLAVAPVGLAFEASKAQRPELSMLDFDLEHQSLAGMYLAACVVYATIFQESPEGAGWFPPGLSTDQAAFLQRVAWASVSS